jgi:hypothetical protein
MLGLSLLGLVCTNFVYIFKNLTTLDLLKGIYRARHDVKKPNLFNISRLTNLGLFF